MGLRKLKIANWCLAKPLEDIIASCPLVEEFVGHEIYCNREDEERLSTLYLPHAKFVSVTDSFKDPEAIKKLKLYVPRVEKVKIRSQNIKTLQIIDTPNNKL